MSCTGANESLPRKAWLMAMLSLPKLGPKRLEALLEDSTPEEIWHRLVDGQPVHVDRVNDRTIEKWRSGARTLSVEKYWEASKSLGLMMSEPNDDTYPQRLRTDIERPELLFGRGALIGHQPTVGIVGTRNCTSYGKRCAFELGAELTKAGVSVVSGLALGIDAAAHDGALSSLAPGGAGPIGVVGSGLDVVYPKRNTSLWNRVGEHGTLLSETAPGVGPQRWRFPARNRIIAALSDAIVVVESHESGGSLLTVDSAQDRDVPVGVVPGPITSNSSRGSNLLLVDGATPVLGADDVLAMIGHARPGELDLATPAEHRASVLLDALGWNPLLFDELCNRVTLSPSELAVEVERLVAEQLCVRNGPWIERVG